MKEQEARLSSMEGNLAAYLESRRLAYNLKRWPARQGDLHGPLAPEVLQPAREKVFERLQELAAPAAEVRRAPADRCTSATWW